MKLMEEAQKHCRYPLTLGQSSKGYFLAGWDRFSDATWNYAIDVNDLVLAGHSLNYMARKIESSIDRSLTSDAGH